MMLFLHKKALEKGVKKLTLTSRLQAKGFYEKLGYIPIGDRFETKKYKIPSIHMEYIL